jgi:hypothetical protein
MKAEDYLVSYAQLQQIESNLAARLRSMNGDPAARSRVSVALSFVQQAKQAMTEPRSPDGSPDEASRREMCNG